MSQAEKLTSLLEPAVQALGYELVGIEFLPQGRHSLLRIYIDAEAGIRIEDCERVSHQVSGILEVEDPVAGQYTLEVSSPGLDRPLFKAEHYVRFMGSKVKLRLRRAVAGRRNISGVIGAVNDAQVTVHDEMSDETIIINLEEIDKANLIAEV